MSKKLHQIEIVCRDCGEPYMMAARDWNPNLVGWCKACRDEWRPPRKVDYRDEPHGTSGLDGDPDAWAPSWKSGN